MLRIIQRAVVTGSAPTAMAARSTDKKKGSKLVFGSDGTRVLDRGGLINTWSLLRSPPACHTDLITCQTSSLNASGVWKKFKYCQQCNLIMVERAKWKNFDEVKYCGDKCRNASKRAAKGEASEDTNDASGATR